MSETMKVRLAGGGTRYADGFIESGIKTIVV